MTRVGAHGREGDHPLPSDREKVIIARRFDPPDEADLPTLETVGRDPGLSRERVRPVQAAALDKLRQALGPAPPRGPSAVRPGRRETARGTTAGGRLFPHIPRAET